MSDNVFHRREQRFAQFGGFRLEIGGFIAALRRGGKQALHLTPSRQGGLGIFAVRQCSTFVTDGKRTSGLQYRAAVVRLRLCPLP